MPRTIPTPNAPNPLGAYSVATETGDLVFISGQVAIDPDTGRKASDSIDGQTHQIMQNVGAILKDAELSYGDVVKTTLFLADIQDFKTVDRIYSEYFPDSYPARSALQAAALPAGYLIEIDFIAYRA